jgi:phospholipase/carboxylesterase
MPSGCPAPGLLARCNALGDCLAAPDTDPEADRRFDQAFEELMALARAHFAAEEALFAARGFAGSTLRNEVEEFDYLAAEIVTTRISTGRSCKPSSASGGPAMSPAPPASIASLPGSGYHPPDALLDGIELQTGDTPRFAVIWMHGLGADGSDFVPVVPHLGLDDAPSIRFVFPNAPQIPVTCNGGYVMPAWYDIISLAPNARGRRGRRAAQPRGDPPPDRAREPARRALRAHLPRRLLAGRRDCLLHRADPSAALAGIVALSTYIPTPALLEAEATAVNAGLPIFAAHGNEDDVVGPNWAPGRAIWCKAAAMPWNGASTRCRIRCASRKSSTSAPGCGSAWQHRPRESP